MGDFVDLRSDTITQPTAAMREAMARAEVGDDVYGEDPTVNLLQERAAELLGKPAALFVPTGTMANQIALLCHCVRGDDVLVGEGAHCMLYESGAGSAWAGVGFSVIGRNGLFTAPDVLAAIHPGEYHFAPTRLVAIENTHNRSGGRVFPQSDVRAIADAAHARGLLVHIDGARIWNAAAAGSIAPALLAEPADSVSACFSKGLGAPVGSVLAGSRELVGRARRFRKMLGGGMRQAGVLAAAALYAIEQHLPRIAEDHHNAQRLAVGLSRVPGIACAPEQVETNIVNFDLPGRSAERFVALAAQSGVRVNAIGPERVRAVTHLDVTAADIVRAVTAFTHAAAELTLSSAGG